jgi:hypothetical protein
MKAQIKFTQNLQKIYLELRLLAVSDQQFDVTKLKNLVDDYIAIGQYNPELVWKLALKAASASPNLEKTLGISYKQKTVLATSIFTNYLRQGKRDKATLAEIGKFLGKKHCTILHNLRRFEGFMHIKDPFAVACYENFENLVKLNKDNL